jgi:hypothetical protein
MDYGQLLTDAWQVVWNNKFLLIIGFLAALGSGSSSSGNNASFNFGDNDIPPGFGEKADVFLAHFAPFIVGMICLALFIAIVFWLIRLTAQAGLISAADRLSAGEKVSLGEALGAGLGKLGRMIGIYLLLYGPFIFLAVILLGSALLLAGTAIGFEFANATEGLEPIWASFGIVITCVALLFCILLPLLLVVTIILPFAQRAAVLEDKGVTASLGRAWWVIRNNLGDTVILVVMFVVMGIVYGIVVAIVLVPLTGLLFLPMLIGMIADSSAGAGNFVALVCGGLGIGLLAAFLNSLWTTYRSTAMTLAYRQLVQKSPE